MKNLVLVCVVAFAFCTTAMAGDIALSTQAGWFGQAAADREMQEIADNVTAVPVEQFTADDQTALADWVVAHTGDGVADLLILCGNFPDSIYPPGNAEPDGSLAELFLDDGNIIVNTGDYLFYVNSGGTNNNVEGGIQNMMDIAGITMWDDNTPVVVTADGLDITPSLVDFQTDRPFHLNELEGAWFAELVLAQNDAGTRADAVIVANAATGGRLGIFYQTSGQDDDPRGEVMSEWINNWYLTAGDVVSPGFPAQSPNPADGAVDSDVTALEWAAAYGAATYKVYLSTDATIDDADLIGETDLTLQVATLDPGTTYYWRVDAVDADGVAVEGPVWSFSTLPLTAHFPAPADGAEFQALDAQLSWTGGKDAIMHNVNFGTDPAALLPVSMMQMDASYDPGPLELETTYYWSVDEFTPAGTVAGPVWSFTTFGGIEITDPNLVLYYDFELGEGAVALDKSGHSNHGTLVGDAQWATGIFGGAIDLDGDGDYVDGGNDAIFDITDGFTLSVWINWRATGATWQTVVAKGDNAWRLARGADTQTMDFGFTAGGDRGWQAARTGSEVPLGEWHHVAATYDTIDGAKIYLDGVLEGTNTDTGGITVGNYPVHVGNNAQAAGRFWDGLLDEVRVYNKTLTSADIQGMVMSDVTAPGDVVQGDPNEPRDGDVAGWPDGEYPWFANDDDVSTKFLHFRGEVSPTGFVVEPAMGPTVVTGLTFTTANDAPERDPVSFELSGSNDSLDGPYALIASGDIADFAQADAWPRFTMNATAISFDNAVGYKYYRVMFPTVRDAGSANSMQIAEVELLGVPAPVARWRFNGDFTGIGPNAQTGVPVGDIAFEDDPVRGQVVSLPGGDNQYVDLGGVGISGNMPKTIACWAKADSTGIPDWTLIFGFTGNEAGDGGNGSHFNIGSLGGPGGVGAHCWGWEETIFSDEEALEWHHYAMTYDGTTIQYYGDGVPMDTDLGKSNVQDLSASADRVHVGSRITQASSFPGKVDDARVYAAALSPIQIREIANEAPLVAFVSFHGGDDTPSGGAAGAGFTEAPDKPYTDLLRANGYNVMRYITTSSPDPNILNLADLVIISRSVSSGGYSNDGATAWNNISAPMIVMGGYVLRSSRMGYTTGGTMPDTVGDITLAVSDPNHPIFAGIPLTDGTMDNPFAGVVVYPTDGITVARGVSINTDPVNADGTILATVATVDDPTVGGMVIGEWQAGATMNHAGGAETDILAGHRLVFLTGAREASGISSETSGLYDLYADGAQMLLNAVAYMLP